VPPRKFPDDPRPWVTVSSSYLFRRAPWLTLRQDHFQMPNGGEIREYWISEFPPWVNVVAVTPQDEAVLIRQYRPGIGDVHFEIPAGVVDPDDHGDFERAAKRELAEETGYGGGRWSLLTTLSANPALQTNVVYTYLAEGVLPLGDAAPEATEDLRVHLVPLAEIPRLVDEGEIMQSLHAAPLLRYLLNRR
jgi:8-oxo-dGDP phosphatase